MLLRDSNFRETNAGTTDRISGVDWAVPSITRAQSARGELSRAPRRAVR